MMRCGKPMGRMDKKVEKVEVLHSLDANYFAEKRKNLKKPPAK